MKISNLEKIDRKYKFTIYFCLDILICIFSVYVSISLRQETFFHYENLKSVSIFFIFLPIIVFLNYYLLKIHKIFLRNFSINDFNKFLFFSFNLTCFLAMFILIFKLYVPRSIILIFFVITFCLFVYSRFTLKKILIKFSKTKSKQKNVVIFGASLDSRKICEYFNSYNGQYKICCFIENEKSLQNLIINGVKVYSEKDFINKYKNNDFDEIWITQKKYDKGIENKAKKTFKFKNILDALYNSINLNFEIDSIADRENFKLNIDISNYVKEQVILVTGAGGSIGSEIAYQLKFAKCKKLILLDISEYSLFSLRDKLNNLDCTNVVYKLGSICDTQFIEDIVTEFNVDTVINCAAYKHVDFVENNKFEAFKNNVQGNYILLKTCEKYDITNFVLVSTDKAVRPTSFMGLTKRMCEISTISQSQRNQKINHKIVRFGNVLNSNGSLLPILKKQILQENLVKITDIKMERFFMSIEEASNLVLSTLKFKKKSGIFILDMGKPLKIIDIAQSLIKKLGYQYENKFEDNFVKIQFIGAKPGEKLYEELSYTSDFENTSINKIFLANEKFNFEKIHQLATSIEKLAQNPSKNILKDFVRENRKFFEYNVS